MQHGTIKMATSMDDELKCGICLELFQDPRSLPCLHTFCQKCLQRSLNENHSLKCPVCRAKHELNEEGAGLLPVNEYALQELPLRRLQQQREIDSAEQQCNSCEEKAPLVAWCKDCDAMICQLCVGMHKKMVILRDHCVVQKGKTEPTASFEKKAVCLEHTGQELKYVCTPCLQLVCPECLLGAHKRHKYRMVSKARNRLETRMEELAGLVVAKEKEFSKYLEKIGKAEGKALEHNELMKSEVNNVFDGIAASVEAQRNEALQSMSQGVKEIWSQKEMVEVSLAQIDSFTRFVDHTHKCTADASYVAMATQCIKLMERLKDTHGDEGVLNHQRIAIGSKYTCSGSLHVPLGELLTLGQPSLTFSPSSGSQLFCPVSEVGLVSCNIKVTLMVGGFPVTTPTLYGKSKPIVEVEYNNTAISPKVRVSQSHVMSWEIIAETHYTASLFDEHELVVMCCLPEISSTEFVRAWYTF